MISELLVEVDMAYIHLVGVLKNESLLSKRTMSESSEKEFE